MSRWELQDPRLVTSSQLLLPKDDSVTFKLINPKIGKHYGG